MRPDDETPREPDADDAGEHPIVPPATWAGRRRAEEAAEDKPAKEPAEEAAEDLRAGFTEEFDEIERDLDQELAGLANLSADDDDDEPELEDDESEDEPEPEPADADLKPVEVPDVEELDLDELADEPDEPEFDDDEFAQALEKDLNAELGDEIEADADENEPAAVAAEAKPDATVEAETVVLGDREQAEEAALAGLRARTAQHEGAAATAPPAAALATAVAEDDGNGKKPRAKRLWARFLAASLLIVISVAAATSISILLYLTDIAKGLSDNDQLASLRDQLAHADGGDPQTILIIGSDKRLGSQGDPGRSDTTILLRVDPDKNRIALLSIPRDLRVNIPGVGLDKFNAAYSAGQEDKTLQVVQRLTGLEINHVVNINFTGFADAVNAIGGVYIDVDRDYYIPEGSGTSPIDIKAGYQLMKGFKALQYVRFRHFDNDLVRSARQQDFLREARQKLPPGTLINDRDELLKIFTDYTTSDIGDAVPLLELLKTFASVQSAPLVEVHFPAELGETYVTYEDEAVKAAVAQFLDTEGTPGQRPAGESPPVSEGEDQKPDGDKPGGEGDSDKPDEGEEKPEDKPDEEHFEGPTMDDATEQGQAFGRQISKVKKHNGDLMVDFPVYYPTRLVPSSLIINDTRAFPIDGPGEDVYHGYKMVVDVPGCVFGNGLLDEYYGVSGTDWLEIPILENPSETRTIDGRDYLLFYDGDRLRTVGWKTGKGAYWVNNSLLQSLEEGQMLSIATSMRELEDK